MTEKKLVHWWNLFLFHLMLLVALLATAGVVKVIVLIWTAK